MNILEKMAGDIEAAKKAEAAKQEPTATEDVKSMIESAVSQAKAEMGKQLEEVKARNAELTAELTRLMETVPGGSGKDTPNGDGGKQDA